MRISAFNSFERKGETSYVDVHAHILLQIFNLRLLPANVCHAFIDNKNKSVKRNVWKFIF